MRRPHPESYRGRLASWCLLALASSSPALAKKKTTTEVVTSTLIIPPVSTARGDEIHASVVAVAADDSVTTLGLRCLNAGSACANGAFAGQQYVFGPATASVSLDRDWACAVSAASGSGSQSGSESASPSTVCSYSAGTTTITAGAWNTAVTITEGVDKLRAPKTTRTTTVVQGGATVTSVITEAAAAGTGTGTMTNSPASPTDDSSSGLCKRLTRGGGHSGDGADGADDDGSTTTTTTTPKPNDADDDDGTGSVNKPCSGASRWGLDTPMMGTIVTIVGLGFVISCL